ncbi:type VII secretion integral membrane protein EccD [Mycolicibacterium sp. XJ1819]
MRDSLCRLTVQRLGRDGADAVDVVLPAESTVAELIPSIVDLFDRGLGDVEHEQHWWLTPLGGDPLDVSLTLAENGVDDGSVLLLTTTEPVSPQWFPFDPTHTLARTADIRADAALPPTARMSCCLLLGVAGAIAIGWSATRSATIGPLVVATGLAVSAAAGAFTLRRVHPDPNVPVVLGVLAVAYAALAGFVAVPADAAWARILLASSASFSLALVLQRVISGGTTCLTVLITMSALTATVSAAAVGFGLPTQAAGAMLATLSLAVLAAAPRLSIAVAGVGPPTPGLGKAADTVADLSADHIDHAHATLTGVVTASSITAAVGAGGAVLADQIFCVAAVLFAAVVAAVLSLRARTHSDPTRRVALYGCGLLSATAGFAWWAAAAPEQAHWLALTAVTAAVALLCGLDLGARSPAAVRLVEILEYVALAAVVPLACWVGGLYELVHDSRLL